MKNKKMFFIAIAIIVVILVSGISYITSDGYQKQRVEKKNEQVGDKVLNILQDLETTSAEEFADMFMSASEVNDVFNRSHIKDRNKTHEWLSTVHDYELDDFHNDNYYELIKFAQAVDFEWNNITSTGYVFNIHLNNGIDLYRGVLQFLLDTDERERYGRVKIDMYRQDGKYKMFIISKQD